MRIVVVDDSRISRDMLRRILRDGGHQVVGEANEGKAGIDQCREHKPDVVLLDCSMPGMQGQEAAQIILAEKLAGRVVVVSSMNQKANVEAMQALGCGFIRKPYDPPEILSELEHG